MKQFLVELDDRAARELERVAPSKKRLRAEFVRLAIRRAIDLELDRTTADAYREQPQEAGVLPADLAGWDPDNALARPARPRKRTLARRRRAKSAA